MLAFLWIVLTFPFSFFRPRHDLALEVLALRHQIMVLELASPVRWEALVQLPTQAHVVLFFVPGEQIHLHCQLGKTAGRQGGLDPPFNDRRKQGPE